MQVGLVSSAPHPPPKTTTLAHANGHNPAHTNTLTFLGKERDYSAQFGVFVRISEKVLVLQVTVLKLFSSGTCASPVIPISSILPLTACKPGVTVSNEPYSSDSKLMTYIR